MFLACPHCGYLVALIVAKDGPARTCPRCGGALHGEAPAEQATSAGMAVAAPVADAADTVEADAPAATPEPAPLRDEISRSLRRAPSAPAREPAAQPAPAESAAPAQDAQRESESESNETDAARAIAAPDTPDTVATDPAPAPARPRDDDSHANDRLPAATGALPPLTATAASAATARGRRQHKPETTVTSARRAPSFARQQARAQAPKPRLHWSGPAAIAALALALVLQVLLAQRAELAADARWRPLVSGLCAALGCTIPPWREPAALTMLNRNVLPAPERAGTLRVSAGFRNDARWPQPWPVLVLSLEDVDGRRVGQRAFAPGEYRRDHRPDELIAPGQSAAVQFEVVEPAPRVVAFTFDFR